MDVVICTALKDCFIVKKNIFYIRRNIEVDTIYILTAKRNSYLFPKRFRNRYHVIVIDEECIITNREKLARVASQHFTCQYRFGWYYQQFLKIGFAQSQYAKDFYLIWDSDTIPLNKLSFTEQGKMIFTPKTEFHKAYFETIQMLIGYDKEVPYSFIAEHMIVSVPIMQELIEKMQTSAVEGGSWPVKIINATPADDPNGFSEFETYGTYCHHHFPERIILRELRTFREGGYFYGRGISKRTLRKLSMKYDTISLESWDTPRKYKHRLHNSMEEFVLKIIDNFNKRFRDR